MSCSIRFLTKACARTSSVRSTTAARSFSTDCGPAQKFRQALEDYRLSNYTYETRSRFQKEVTKVLAQGNTVQLDTLNVFLKNIGRHDALLSEAELDALSREAGASSRIVETDRIVQLM